MFPHMYKVRPGKLQQVREPGMATDLQRQRGDNWRKSSNQWGSQGYEGNNSPSSGGGSSFLQNPPAIPAPPPDPQDNLTRKSSLPSKEPERKGTSSPVFALQHNSSRGSPSKRESSVSPPRTRTRARVQDQNESDIENSVPVVQENSYPPPGRRSRVRPAESTSNNIEQENTNVQSVQTRSRSRINENSAQNARNEDASSVPEEVTLPPPGRMRSRSRQNEEISNATPTVEATYPPRTRTRSRSRQIENSQDDAKEEEATFVLPLRTRSRARPTEESSNGPTTIETTSPVLPRTRSRSRPTEEIKKDLSNSVNYSFPPPSPTRSRSHTNEDAPNETVVENALPLQREQSISSIGETIADDGDVKVRNEGQEGASSVPSVTIRIRRRPKPEDNEQAQSCDSVSTITADGTPVRTRMRIRSQESENDDNKTIENQASPVRRRTRTHQPETDSEDQKVNEQNLQQQRNTTETQKNDVETPHEEERRENNIQMKDIEKCNDLQKYPSPPPQAEEIIEILENEKINESKESENIEQIPEKQNSPNLSRQPSITNEENAVEISTDETPIPVQLSANPKNSQQKDETGLDNKGITEGICNASTDEVVEKGHLPLHDDLLEIKCNNNLESDTQPNEDTYAILASSEARNSPEKGEHEPSPSSIVKTEERDASLFPENKNLSPSPAARRRSNDTNDLEKGINQFSTEERKRFTQSPSPYAEQYLKYKEDMDHDQSQQNDSLHQEESESQSAPALNSQSEEGISEAVHITIEPSTPVDGVERRFGESDTSEIQETERDLGIRGKSQSRESSPRRRSRDGSEQRNISISPVVSNASDMQETERNQEIRKLSGSRESSPRRRISNVSEEPQDKVSSISDGLEAQETERKLEVRDISGSRESSPRDGSGSHGRSPVTTLEDETDVQSKMTHEEKEQEEEEGGKASLNGYYEDETDVPRTRHRSPLNIETDTQLMNDVSFPNDKFEDDQKNEEEMEINEEVDEEDEEDPIMKATRLWLLSKNQNSEILDKVLPDLENDISTYKIKAPTQTKEDNWWDEDSEDQAKKEIKPKVIEEWNEEFDEEPKNYTTFASIKLKSRPPKSPPIKEKKGRVLSNEEEASLSLIPPPPPPPPPGSHKSKSRVPEPPPPPPPAKLSEKEVKVKKARVKMVDKIKRAARQRPDWKSVMKDIEVGIKLRKVNSGEKLDRSNPILPKSRGKGGKFFYESEKPVVQNQLLGEIQRGVKLRHVKTNDRSKPDFNKLGLRKLRRQMTVEEKKSLDPHAPELLPSSSDEDEDIDQMRDDLASTKAQLAEEMKKNKKIGTEHKILKIDLKSLEAEVKKLKRKLKEAGIHEIKPLTNGEAEAIAPKLSKSMSKLRMMEEEMDFSELDTIEEDIQLLNDQIEAQKKRAEKAELKCEEFAQKMQVSQNSADEWEMRSVYFEKKYKTLQKDQGIELPDIDCSGTQTDPVDLGTSKSESFSGLNAKKSSSRKSFASFSRMQSFKEEGESDDDSSSSSEEDTLSDHQGGDDEDEERESDENEDDEMKGNHIDDVEKREEREFIMWKNRLSHAKDKVKNVRKERNNLRERVKKFFKDMRKEREEYLKLKGELKELLDQMKDPDDVKEGVEDEEEEDEEEEENSFAEDDEAPEWWCDETPQKPKKLKKRKKKAKENDDEDEIIVDMSGLDDPYWTETEGEESEEEDEDEDIATRIKSLKEKTKKLEENMNAKKKETYLLKGQVDRCEEMFGEEKRRHERLDSELHMLLSDI